MIDYTTIEDELTLKIPFKGSDGRKSILNVSIDHFPYYLKTDDFSDFIRLALLQQEFHSLFNWNDLTHNARFQKFGHNASQKLDEHQELLISRAFVNFILHHSF